VNWRIMVLVVIAVFQNSNALMSDERLKPSGEMELEDFYQRAFIITPAGLKSLYKTLVRQDMTLLEVLEWKGVYIGSRARIQLLISNEGGVFLSFNSESDQLTIEYLIHQLNKGEEWKEPAPGMRQTRPEEK